MGTRCFISMRDGNRIKGVSCSYDGYIECTGLTLLSAFSDRSTLGRLIDRGDMSSLGTGICNTAFYGSGRPRTYPDAKNLCEKEDAEYAYLLDEDGRWYYYRAGDESARDLENDLRLAYPEGFRAEEEPEHRSSGLWTRLPQVSKTQGDGRRPEDIRRDTGRNGS